MCFLHIRDKNILTALVNFKIGYLFRSLSVTMQHRLQMPCSSKAILNSRKNSKSHSHTKKESCKKERIFIFWSKKSFSKRKYFYPDISWNTGNSDMEQSYRFILRHPFWNFGFIFDLKEVNISVRITMQEIFQDTMNL